MVEANVETIDTWREYETEPATAFQDSVGFNATPVAPFAGLDSTGAAGRTIARDWKFPMDDQLPVPFALDALTRQ